MARTGENIYKRKDGRWEARYIYSYTAEGKAQYKYLYASTYSEVKAKLLLHRSSMRNDVKTSRNKETYHHWLDEWLKSKRLSVKESTYMRYAKTIENHIKPALGKYPIGKISTELMEQYVADKLQTGRLDASGGLSSKTMSDIMVVIKESFKYAEACGVDTVCRFDRISFKKTTKEMRVLSVTEEQQLMSVLMDTTDRYKLGVFICLYTGIRIGELCALKWKHISLTEKTVKVEQTMQRLQYETIVSDSKTRIIVTEPKSHSAYRTIPLPDFVIDVIIPFVGHSEGYILSDNGCSVVEPRTMQNHFKAYLAEGNIEDSNFHALRHTFATRCVEAGFDIKTLSEILGHASVKITLDKYVHSSMELKRLSMDKLRPARL